MWMFNRLRLFWDTVKEATESVWSPQGPGNTLEARDSKIQGTLQQNAPMYLSTNLHGKNPVAPLPLECFHLTPKSDPKSFKVLFALPSHLQTPDLSLSTQFGKVPFTAAATGFLESLTLK